MTGFKVFKTYLALKSHFETNGYDFFKYNGKVNTKLETFEARNDKFKFNKIAKKLDTDSINPAAFFVANYIEAGNFKWIGEYADEYDACKKKYLTWLGRQQALLYNLETDLTKIGNVKQSCIITDHKFPQLLQMLRQKTITPETVIIIDSVSDVVKYWDKKIEDKYIWPETKATLVKYKGFVNFDKTACKEKVLAHFN